MHLQAASDYGTRIGALRRQVEDEGSALTPDERAACRREIDALSERIWSEERAGQRLLDEFNAQHSRVRFYK